MAFSTATNLTFPQGLFSSASGPASNVVANFEAHYFRECAEASTSMTDETGVGETKMCGGLAPHPAIVSQISEWKQQYPHSGFALTVSHQWMDRPSVQALIRTLHMVPELHLSQLTLSNIGLDDQSCCESGLIPYALSHRVASLDLSENSLANGTCAALAANLCNSMLSHLNLSKNLVADAGMSSLAQGLRGNTSLHTLQLKNNLFSDVGVESLASALTDNSSLTSLNLSGNNIGSRAMAALCSSENGPLVRPSCHIRELQLAHCPLGSEGLAALTEALPRITPHLKTLNLEATQLVANDILALCIGLSSFDSLIESLVLSHNVLLDDGAMAVADLLTMNPMLTSVALRGIGMTALSCDSLSNALEQNSRLNAIDLSENALGDAGAIALCRGFHGSQSIQSIDLHSTKIGPEGFTSLTQVLLDNSFLMYLDLSSNFGGDSAAQQLSDVLKQNNMLTSLSLANNEMSEAGVELLRQGISENMTLCAFEFEGESEAPPQRNSVSTGARNEISERVQANEALKRALDQHLHPSTPPPAPPQQPEPLTTPAPNPSTNNTTRPTPVPLINPNTIQRLPLHSAYAHGLGSPETMIENLNLLWEELLVQFKDRAILTRRLAAALHMGPSPTLTKSTFAPHSSMQHSISQHQPAAQMPHGPHKGSFSSSASSSSKQQFIPHVADGHLVYPYQHPFKSTAPPLPSPGSTGSLTSPFSSFATQEAATSAAQPSSNASAAAAAAAAAAATLLQASASQQQQQYHPSPFSSVAALSYPPTSSFNRSQQFPSCTLGSKAPSSSTPTSTSSVTIPATVAALAQLKLLQQHQHQHQPLRQPTQQPQYAVPREDEAHRFLAQQTREPSSGYSHSAAGSTSAPTLPASLGFPRPPPAAATSSQVPSDSWVTQLQQQLQQQQQQPQSHLFNSTSFPSGSNWAGSRPHEESPAAFSGGRPSHGGGDNMSWAAAAALMGGGGQLSDEVLRLAAQEILSRTNLSNNSSGGGGSQYPSLPTHPANPRLRTPNLHFEHLLREQQQQQQGFGDQGL